MKFILKIFLLLSISLNFIFAERYDYDVTTRDKKILDVIIDNGPDKGFVMKVHNSNAHNYYKMIKHITYDKNIDDVAFSTISFKKANQYVFFPSTWDVRYFYKDSTKSNIYADTHPYVYSYYKYKLYNLCPIYNEDDKKWLINNGVPADIVNLFDIGDNSCKINCSNVIRGSVFSFGKCVCPIDQFVEEKTKQCLSCNLINEDNYTLKVAEQCFCKGAGFKRDEISKIASAVLNCERFVTIGDKTLGVNYIFKDGKGYAGVTGFFCNGETGPDFNFVVPAPEKCAPSTPQPDPEPAPDPNNPNPDKPDPNNPDPNKPKPDKPDPNTPPVPKPDDNGSKPDNNGSKPNDDNSNPDNSNNDKNINVHFNDGRIVKAIEKTNEILTNDSIHIEKIKDRLDDLLDSNDYKDFDKKDLNFDVTDGKNLLKQSSDTLKNISDVMGNTLKDTKNQVGNIKKSIDNAISKLKDPLGRSISSYKTCKCLYSKPLNLGFKTISIQMDPCEFICKINNVTYLVFFITFFYIFLKFTIFLLFKMF